MGSRKHVRLRNFDYRTPGFYFITICTDRKRPLFGRIENGLLIRTPAASLAENCWNQVPEHYPGIVIDMYVIMPNHFHGLIQLLPEDKTRIGTHALSKIVTSFKAAVTKAFRTELHDDSATIWQRGFYEHVVRDEESLYLIRLYIQNNPLAWELDKENPHRTGTDQFDKWLDRL